MRWGTIFFLIFILAVSSNSVLACSGPRFPLEDFIMAADSIVHARVVYIDVIQQNYIVEVETYLAGGSGPKYLLISQHQIMESQAGYNGFNPCYYSLPSPPTQGDFYLMLQHNSTWGYYEPLPRALERVAFFDFEQANVPSNADDITEAEFLDLVAELRGDNPTAPNSDSPYPSKAPLLITTENGTEYILPVDGSPPHIVDEEIWQTVGSLYKLWLDDSSCIQMDCLILAENGRVAAAQKTDGGFVLSNQVNIRNGNDLLFSGSGYAAVWQDNDLHIYQVHRPLYNESMLYPWTPPDIPIASISIVSHKDVYGSTYARWNAGGTLLAYSDAEGLWLWSPFIPDSSPELLLTSTESGIPIPIDFSPYGRFLSLYIPSRGRQTIDLINRATLPYAVFSPNERFVVFEDNTPVSRPFLGLGTVQDMMRFQVNKTYDSVFDLLAFHGNYPVFPQTVYKVEWLNDNMAILLLDVLFIERNVDSEEIPEPEQRIWYVEPTTSGFYLEDSQLGRDFSVANGEIAVIVDDEHLSINRAEPVRYDLDSPIAKIRWLPTLFFEH